MRIRSPLVFLLALSAPVAPALADGSLRGSRTSVRHQHEVAREADLTFLRTPAQVREFVDKERLEPVTSTAHLTITRVSFPYTRPIVKTFLERLSEQYHAATGNKLVVTSLTRPKSRQPSNASPYSVHPAGIAVDLRVPATSAERAWLEETLLSLERANLLDVTRERRPPHYHVAIFPEQYEKYVAMRLVAEVQERAEAVAEAAVASVIEQSRAAELPAAPVPEQDLRMPAALLALLLATAGGSWLYRERSRASLRPESYRSSSS